jgi:hypothetical protein
MAGLLLDQLNQVAALRAGQADDGLVEGGKSAAVVFGYAQKICVSDLFRAMHAALERGCCIKVAYRCGPEGVTGLLRERKEQCSGIAERVMLAHYFNRTGDAQETGLRE